MKQSRNILNNKIYDIPTVLDDSKNIDDFISLNSKKKVIVVQGLGFVGAVMSLVCANSISEDYAVIGIDLPNENSFWKIKSINEGFFPLVADDPKIEDFFNKSINKKNFYATYDPYAYKFADVIIVDINLDVQKKSLNDLSLENFDVDLSGFKKAIESIGKNFKDNALVLVETTVPPGTCEKIVKPILETELQKRGLSTENYMLGHSYERVMPGPNYIDSIREYPRVFSGINEKSANKVKNFLETIIDTSVCDLTELNHTNASEIAKVLENSYRATNIAFAIEWTRFAEEAGVDLYSIVNAIRVRDTHSNLMYPGIGVGGYCLTKDPLLASWSKENIFKSVSGLEMSKASVSSNDQMPRFAFERLIKIYGNITNKNILLLGISYRGDVGDTRFTPVNGLYRMLQDAKANLKLHDPFVAYWEENNINIQSNLDDALVSGLDIIIISAGHSIYKDITTIDKLLKLNKLMIFDTIGLFSELQIKQIKEKHIISVLGRGDLE